MKKCFVLLMSVLFIISGCAKEEQKTNNENKPPELIEVTIKTPKTVKLNEEVNLEASVMQGKEKVKDADEVKFEIRKTQAADSEMIEGKHQRDGVYSAKTTFKENGVYIVTAHVTARDMHSMPNQKITVGRVNEPANQDHADNGHEDAHKHHHHDGNVEIHFHTEKAVKANQKIMLAAHITNETKPLTGAMVRFEIWQGNDNKHEFIQAANENNGEYISDYTFLEPGRYSVKVHVEKGEIHEHQLETIEVK
jgi:hypothetical protein